MTTIIDLKEYADRKNLKFDTFTKICHNRCYFNSKKDNVEYMLDNNSHKSFSKTYFGLQTSNGIWYWFKKSNICDEITELYFEHRYSQITGQCVKGFRTGFNLSHKIKKYLNK